MTSIDEALRDLSERLQRHHPRAAALLRPGLARDELARRAMRLPFALPDEAVALYAWRDGMNADPTSPVTLMPDYEFLPFGEALEQYDAVLATAQAVAAQTGLAVELLWDPHWFPIFSYVVGGEFLVLRGETSPVPSGSIWSVLLEDASAATQAFDSLTTLLATVATAYEQGAYIVTTDGSVRVDPAQFDALRRTLNPISTSANQR